MQLSYSLCHRRVQGWFLSCILHIGGCLVAPSSCPSSGSSISPDPYQMGRNPLPIMTTTFSSKKYLSWCLGQDRYLGGLARTGKRKGKETKVVGGVLKTGSPGSWGWCVMGHIALRKLTQISWCLAVEVSVPSPGERTYILWGLGFIGKHRGPQGHHNIAEGGLSQRVAAPLCLLWAWHPMHWTQQAGRGTDPCVQAGDAHHG